MNYGEEELLDDNIINPIPILQSSLFAYQNTLGPKALLSPSFHLASSFPNPPPPSPISMVVVVNSFHTPYSCWPPSGVTTNENRYFI